jgi:hypothetical protein
MFDKSDIRAAVESGAISDEAARRFESYLHARNDSDRGLGSENLRFLTNFNDIFLTIGIFVLMTGLGFLSFNIINSVFDLEGLMSSDMPGEAAIWRAKLAIMLMPVPVLLAAWALAEYFCGRRRLLLPSMALACIITSAASLIFAALLIPTTESAAEAFADNPLGGASLFGYALFGGSALAAAAIFWRFRLPFSLFLIATSIAGLFYVAVARIDDGGMILGGSAMLIVGLITLAVAIWFDMRDPQRTSRVSDQAFWLHLAAAPQIIFGIRGLVLGSGFAPAGTADATVMLLVLIAFALLSLALNRRALIVSGLISFATALWVLVDRVGWGGLNTVMLTALIVGASIVLLGGGWRTARRILLRPMPQTGLTARIFPPEPA